MAKRGRRLAREEEMRAVLAKWERSDLPLSRFAKREGVAVKTLYRWRRRLGVGERLVRRGRLPGRGQRRREPSRQSLFAELSVAPRQASSSSTTMFEVVLSEGTTVRVPQHFDPDSLRILLAALREC